MRRVALTLLVAAMAGCSSSQNSTGSTTFTRTDSGTVVEVLLDEYAIHMPTTIPGGDVTFKVRNTGSHTHTIEVAGKGVDATLKPELKEGESGELNVRLEPGTYKVTCPIGPHAALGMRLELTVTAR